MAAALRILRLRDRSAHEVTLALEKKGFAPPLVSGVLRRLRELGYLDDARFAQHRALALLRNGRFGSKAVLMRLRAHGLSDAEARKAVASAETELGFDPKQTAISVLQSRDLWGRPLTDKEKGKAARLLAGRGFSSSLIAELLGEGE